ncbi:putative Ig domain-containing protein [Mesorhizobium sp. YR577]|uniref:putative Ig domain-containing protein n=1 Tax=Mesorhizobium sp. YR577 TaxID=1884373 RepID=UPI001587E4DC|nr:putative Ig domain-containing protein [Mesorhizobium sp. YR577]
MALVQLCSSPTQAAPPFITQHPQDVTAGAGQFVSFSVTTSASEATFQWQVSTNGFDFSTIPVATESTYTFKPVRVSETGTLYRVVVSKDGESAYSRPATLTITKAISIVLVDELPQGRVYGQSVQIKAIVIGTSAKPNGEITFMDGNTRIGDPVSFDTSNGANLTITTNELGAGQHTITAIYSGDESHEPSVSSGVVIDIAKADQSIYFDTVPPRQAIVGQTYEVTAHTIRVSQSVPVEVKVEGGDICTVSNGVVAFLNAGDCVVSAQHMGDANFNDSHQATQTVPVIAAPAQDHTVSWSSNGPGRVTNVTFNDDPQTTISSPAEVSEERIIAFWNVSPDAGATYREPSGCGIHAVGAAWYTNPITVDCSISFSFEEITISPAALVKAIVGATFSQTIAAKGGHLDFVYTQTGGTLPAGLTLTDTGELSGTPTETGSFTFTVQAANARAHSKEIAYTLTIEAAAPSPAVTSVTGPADGYYGAGDSLVLTVHWGGNIEFNTGGGTPYIPLTIGTTTRHASYLSGSGSSASVFRYTVQPGDAALGGIRVGTAIVANGGTIQDVQGTDADLTLNNVGTTSGVLVYAVNPEVVSSRVVGTPAPDAESVTFEVTFSEAVTDFTGSDLVLTSTGTAIGRPALIQTSDNIHYTVRVDDIAGSGTIRLDVLANAVNNIAGNSNPAFIRGTPWNVSPAMILTPPDGSTLSSGLVGAAYNDGSISATGGVGTITYGAAGLPVGLSIDPATGAITGTPTADGTVIVAVTATGATSGTATASYTIVVATAPLPISLTPVDGSTLTAGVVGAIYNDDSISATGGLGTITFIATGLPAGLSVGPATGAITGTPTADGTFTVAVTATGATTGTATASYTIVVAPASLSVSLTPADGSALSAGVVGTTYNDDSISASGGVSTITYSATGLPSGLVIDGASGAITGTPTADGAFTVNVTATAGTSGSASASYTIVVAPAPPILAGISPATGSTMGGTALTITGNHLTGTTGVMLGSVAATSIAVVSNTQITAIAPANAAGSADVSVTAPGGTATLAAAFTYVAPANLTFSPASGSITEGTAGVEYTRAVLVTGGTAPYSFSATGLPEGMGIDPHRGTIHGLPTTPGNYTIIVKVRDQNGLNGTATYSLTLGGIYRPDPSQDTEVIGLINAQAQAAQRFATTQISNFNDRLERLHSDQSRHAQSLSIRMGVTQKADRTKPMRPEGERPGNDPAGRAMGPPHKEPAAEVGDAAQSLNGLFGDTAFWTGGFVNFGTSDRGNIDLGYTLAGVSGGIDHRFAPDFVAGFGFGYGRDRTDIGSSGTISTGHALSIALYGSYHPTPFYLDGLLGVSRLDFHSTRYVILAGDSATGSRDGTQFFGSLSAGYEHRHEGLLFSPYGRIEAAHTRLDGFAEIGAGPHSLAFSGQSFELLAGVVGMRAEHAIPMGWGVINTRGRLEYTYDFAGSSQANMGYSDLGTMPYTLDLDRYMRDYMTAGLGVDVKLGNDMTLSFDYRTAFGFDGNAQDHTFGIRIGGNF